MDKTHSPFPTTRWTMIEALRDQAHPRHTEARAALLTNYWAPIYAFVRRSGKRSEEAEELTQAFFAEVVLQRQLFESADAKRGQLRSLLRGCVRNFIVDMSRRNAIRATRPLPITEDGRASEERLLRNHESEHPEQAFDRRWALGLLLEAMKRCEELYANDKGRPMWQAFERRVVRPSLAMHPPLSYEEIAGELGFATPKEAESAVRSVRKRVQTLLKEVAAETATDPDDQNAEYRHVITLLT